MILFLVVGVLFCIFSLMMFLALFNEDSNVREAGFIYWVGVLLSFLFAFVLHPTKLLCEKDLARSQSCVLQYVPEQTEGE